MTKRNWHPIVWVNALLLLLALFMGAIHMLPDRPAPVTWTPTLQTDGPISLSGLTVVLTEQGSDSYELWLISDLTGEPTRHQIALDGDFSQVRLSPDGRYLAYAQDNDAVWKLRAINLGTGQVATLFETSRDLMHIADWSRDGEQILLIQRDGYRDPGELDMCSVRTGQVEVLVPMSRDLLFNACFSPDGRQIAFFSTRIEPNPISWLFPSADEPPEFALNVLSIRSRTRRSIASGIPDLLDRHCSLDELHPPPLAWSPTGDRIIFQACYKPSDPGSVYMVHLDGSHLRELVQVGNARMLLRWGQGETLAYSKSNCIGRPSLLTFDIQTGEERDVFDKLPSPYECTWVETWSPDGRHIAFVGYDYSGSQTEMIFARDGICVLDVRVMTVHELPLEDSLSLSRSMIWLPD
ncbi:MAG: hypothetical protein KKA73_29400 [Chloroflexi bacterium]|nr:hypothetical protein [Chloroflexota bacterium]MBU1751813.1 hypothetical protein [Chloroflexota bacterium]MBU1877896.1 hypothetical protein [Chloroflexota bacterium]